MAGPADEGDRGHGQPARRVAGAASARAWGAARGRFLGAVDPRQRAEVGRLLGRTSPRGVGLRCWLSAVAWGGSQVPAALPFGLTQVYLDDAGAAPLLECGGCGIALPARVGPGKGVFPACPACGAA